MPIPWLQRRFKELNPDVPLDLIDFEAWYDSTLTDIENLEIFTEAYPTYKWFTDIREQRESRQSLRERLEENLNFLRYTVSTFPEDVSKELEPIIEDLGKRAIQSVSLQRTIRKLRSELRGKKAEEWRRRLGEIVPVGPPREVPIERIPLRPPPAVEARAERLVESIGRRIIEAPDYYSALGVPRDAKTEVIIDTVRLFISTYHPDVYPKPEAEAITRKLVEIRDVLTDPAKRRAYDLKIGVPAPPTVPVAVGRPVVYCTQCQAEGLLVMMEYKKTVGPFKSTGRSYDIYECPACKKERIGNFFRGIFLGFGK